MSDEIKKEETTEEVNGTESQADVFETVKKTAEDFAEDVKKGLSETMDKVKDDPKESIEKTVEDLKKKIQNLSSGENNDGIDLKLSSENKEKLEAFRENTINTVNETISQAKKAASDLTDKESFSKTIDYLKNNAIKAVDTARETFNDFAANPDVKRTIDSAEAKVKEFGEKTSSTLDSIITDERKETLRKGLEQANTAINETVEKTSQAINEFVSKPEVKETIEKTKTGAKELADKGAEVFKDLFDKKEEE